MAIPKIKRDDIINAFKYIDENGIPDSHQSLRYELISEDGKRYPPMYTIAVADHLANNVEISTVGFNAIEAKNYLQGQGYKIETKQQEKFKLVITANKIESTDENFTMDNLYLGDNYKPLDVYLKKADGSTIKRKYNKGERRNSNQTLPRLAFQEFEKQIAALSVEEKETFPICQYKPNTPIISGIYSSVDEYKKTRNWLDYLKYYYSNGRQFVIYCWNIFSTLIFVQECLKRFGEPGDQFVLTYRKKEKKESETDTTEIKVEEELVQQEKEYLNPYSAKLIESKNLIFHGAPGTGKTYLAREIATDIISNGYFDDYTLLTDEQKEQIEFVQFHPSYDYTDFVEGLRPKLNDDGTIGFELKDGIFKRFVTRARKNYEDSQKSIETIEKEISIQESIMEFLSNIKLGVDKFKTISGNEFFVTNVDDDHIYISIPGNASANKITLTLDIIRRMLESGETFKKVSDITSFVGTNFTRQRFSYDLALYKEILKRKKEIPKASVSTTELKPFIFIIDEINRGEISKIFGELFFAADPSYRGRAGEVSTQYSNLHTDPDDKLYVPENVYIIGTMNDIDRSVDSFDFAMRRRFAYEELKANEQLEMLSILEDEELITEVIQRMTALNQEIAKVEDLNENYQIGASYFLKLKTLSFDELWKNYLEPLLQEYIQGIYNEEGIMNRFAKAYGYQESTDNDLNETT